MWESILTALKAVAQVVWGIVAPVVIGVTWQRKVNAEEANEVKDRQLDVAAGPRPGRDDVLERMRRGEM